jgi:O-methyltransferase involved in polyketide biosynthesis
MDHHKSTMKSITKLISKSSQNFFSAFLEDSQDKKNKAKERRLILKKLQVAAAQKSLVVLQLKENPTSQKFETVSGWIVSKNITDSLMLRLQEEPQQLRMILVDSIMKVSALSTGEERQIK